MWGIDIAFWIGMGVTGAVVVAGCLVAWLVPPSQKREGAYGDSACTHGKEIKES